MRINNWENIADKKKDFLPYYIAAAVAGCFVAIMLMFMFDLTVIIIKIAYE